MTPQEFRLAVKHRLLDMSMNQTQLIAEVRSRTGMYLDRSYLNKIFTGEKHPAKIITAICEILGLPEE